MSRFVYCFVLRRYNGDWKWDALALSHLLTALCSCFDAEKMPLDNAHQAVQEAVSSAMIPPIGTASDKSLHFYS